MHVPHKPGAPSDTAHNPRPRQPSDLPDGATEQAPSRDEIDNEALAERRSRQFPRYHRGSNSVKRARA